MVIIASPNRTIVELKLTFGNGFEQLVGSQSNHSGIEIF